MTWKFVFEDHQPEPIAACLVNCLAPRDRNIRVVARNRDESQSFFVLNSPHQKSAAACNQADNSQHDSEIPIGTLVREQAAPKIPESLVAQLADSGRLVVPAGNRCEQQLQVVCKLGAWTSIGPGAHDF